MMRKKELLRKAEYLKHVANRVIDNFHSGAYAPPGQAPNPADAKAALWSEIEAALLSGKNFGASSLRVTCKYNKDVTQVLIGLEAAGYKVIASRYLGNKDHMTGKAIEGGILYLTVDVPNVVRLAKAVQQLRSIGIEIRDWSFGCTPY